MKKIVLKIGDEAYDRALRAAKARNITLSDIVEELVDSLIETSQPADRVANLLAALDHGRNTAPIGPLRREELHHRAILH